MARRRVIGSHFPPLDMPPVIFGGQRGVGRCGQPPQFEIFAAETGIVKLISD